jgi:hypothetical protein
MYGTPYDYTLTRLPLLASVTPGLLTKSLILLLNPDPVLPLGPGVVLSLLSFLFLACA